MAEAQEDILGLLKSIQNSQRELHEKVALLEENASAPPIGNEGNEPNDKRNIAGFEHSESESETEENQNDLQFKTRTKTKPQGPPISDELADQFQLTLLHVTDVEAIKTIHDLNLSPSNVGALKVPDLNPEVRIAPMSTVAQTENVLAIVQKDICTAMSISANLLSDLGKRKNRKLGREEMFALLNDTVSVLAASHKSLSFARRLNVKNLLNENLHILCTKKALEERKNNDLLFGDDMGKQAEEAKKQKELVMKTQAKNGYGAPKRG